MLCRQYDAQRALELGLVNAVVPLERLEEETVAWCREMLALSPFALRLLKASFNADEDGLAGLQQLAHDANLLFYGSEEAREGRNAFIEKRPPDFSRFPRTTVRIWLMAARPRTLPAAIAPVLVGTSLAIRNGPFHALAFIAALLGAVLIQIGTNLSNDYSDARRGADTDDRIGPVRVTAGGLLPPHQVLVATYLTFGAAVLCGVYLIAVAGWLLLAVGAASILAGRPLHGRSAAVRLRGARRGLRVPVLRHRRGHRLVLRAAPHAALAGVRARRPGRPPDLGDPRRQQRARHRHRPPRRQAHAGGAPRPRPHAHDLHRDARARVRELVGAVVRRLALAVAVPDGAGRAARVVGRARRAHPQRRAVAERGAGRRAPSSRCCSASCSAPACSRADGLEYRRVERRFAAPQATAHGLLRARELVEVTLTDSHGLVGRGEAAPLESYDGVPIELVLEALARYRDVLGATLGGRRCGAARRLPRGRRPPPGARRGRHRPLGSRRQARASAPSASC